MTDTTITHATLTVDGETIWDRAGGAANPHVERQARALADRAAAIEDGHVVLTFATADGRRYTAFESPVAL